MQGKIIKAISGFYYVYAGQEGISYACRARGIFRKEGEKPLVGDNVTFEITHEKDREGNVTALLPRKNALIRPAVANVDQAMVVFAMARPEPNLIILDRFLIMMEMQRIPCVICFNKVDLSDEAAKKALVRRYAGAGCQLVFSCAESGEGIGRIRKILSGKTTVFAGPSGVGKSSITNALQSAVVMETGQISDKLRKGKNTTRHSQIIPVFEGSFLIDTPGFTSLDLPGMEKEDLEIYFPEFAPFRAGCRFLGCSHSHEPDCRVKEAVSLGQIDPGRYESYLFLYEELKNARKY